MLGDYHKGVNIMHVNTIKIFAGHAIVTSEMSASAKNQLLNYVQEATEHQVKAFLLDGEIMKNPDDIVCENIIDDRFENSDLPMTIKIFSKEWGELMAS